MNYFLRFFLLLNIQYCFAFQEPVEAYTFDDSELNELVQKGKKQAYEEEFDQSIKTFQSLQLKCWKYGMDSIAIDLYEEIFDLDFQKMKGLEPNLTLIDSFKQQEKDPNILGIYYGALAHNYLFYGEPDSMKKYYNLACGVYREQQRYLQEANLNLKISNEWYYLEKISLAFKYLKKAEQLYEQKLKTQNIHIAILYNTQTMVYYETQDYEKAIQSALKTIYHDKKNKLSSIYTISYEYNNIALLLKTLSDYESALDYYNKALSLTLETKTKNPNKIVYLFLNLGEVYGYEGKIKEEKALYLKGLNLLLEADSLNLESQQDFCMICRSLAFCYRNTNQTDSVLYYIKKASEFKQSASYLKIEIYKLQSLYFSDQNNAKQARYYALKALNIAIKNYNIKSREVAISYNFVANIFYTTKDYKTAIKYSQKALESISSNFSIINEGFPNPTIRQVSDKKIFLEFLNKKMQCLNELYKQNAPNVSQEDLYQTAKLATETIDQINKGIKNRKSQQDWLNKKALPAFEQAIEIALSIYKKTNDFQYLNEAFMLSERSKSMLMLGKLQSQKASVLGGVPDRLIQKERSLEREIAIIGKKRLDARLNDDFERIESLDSLVFGYKHQLLELLHLFEFEYPDYYKLKYAVKNTSIDDVQGVLDKETTLIEYFEGIHHLYIFSISKENAKVSKVKKTATYKADIANFRSSLVSIHPSSKTPMNHYNKFTEAAYKFYNQYLKASLNQHTNRLIIIPDGHLNYLPFEVFLNKEIPLETNQAITDFDYASLPYLIREYKINYNYSATLLIEHLNHKKPTTNGQILAFAPSYNNKTAPSWRNPYEQELRKRLVKLPGASRELSFLKWNFKGSFWNNNSATEQHLKKEISNYGILHFAVHGLVNKTNSDFSGLALSEDNSQEEDNILYAYEIKELNLNANLVVLSACETGIGQYQVGEGVLSLGRDFMYAGTPSLLSALWSLNDYSSSFIIKAFYNNLA